jgi:hypothetical protein
LWARFGGFPTADTGAYRPHDYWALAEGDKVLLTGRPTDVPPDYRDLDAPFIWRLEPGDRVAWIGVRGKHGSSDQVHQRIMVADCAASSIVVRESSHALPSDLKGILEDFMGMPAADTPRDTTIGRLRAGLLAIEALGPPRTLER